MRWKDIDTSEEEWVYAPSDYKEIKYVDYKAFGLMPICKGILERYKDTPPDEIIFNRFRNAREMGNSTKRLKNEMFNKDNYATYIREACEKAGITPHWTPYQLRHRGATDIDETVGFEAARDTLGHTNNKTPKRYIHKTKESKKARQREIIRQRIAAEKDS